MAQNDCLSLISAAPLPMLIVGPTERIEAANAHAGRLLGVDCTGWHYITALRQPALLDAVEAALQDGGKRAARYQSNDGAHDTTWDVTVSAVVLDFGRSVLLSFQDVTALEEAGQMRRDFVANVSHELRTPLTALVGFIETLRGPARNDAAAQERFLGIMEQEAGRMHRLVEDLLSLSRVEDDERVRPKDPVALGPLVEECLRSLKGIADERGMVLQADLPEAEVTIPGDAGQLRQVIVNLVENAIKYGRPESTVRLRLTEPAHEPMLRENGVRLSVQDEGEGIAVHHIARLTERFYRVDSHRSRQIGGTGLGLAIVKHIVNRHRGRLRIESELGQGSCFTAVLPAGLGANAD